MVSGEYARVLSAVTKSDVMECGLMSVEMDNSIDHPRILPVAIISRHYLPLYVLRACYCRLITTGTYQPQHRDLAARWSPQCRMDSLVGQVTASSISL